MVSFLGYWGYFGCWILPPWGHATSGSWSLAWYADWRHPFLSMSTQPLALGTEIAEFLMSRLDL